MGWGIVFYSFLLFVLILSGLAYSNTIEDVRIKTGWKPSIHKTDVSDVTPSELIAYLDKYNKNVIKMQVLFSGITSEGLNKWVSIDGTKHRWTSKRYISFKVKDPKQKHICKHVFLFINKANPDVEILAGLTKGTPFFVTGMVKNTTKGKAWIDVIKLEHA
jgi:hypothetical protein